MRREKLSETEVNEALKQLEGWKFKKDKIKKKFEFANFAEALAFVNKVGEIAERLDHHPDIKFGWGYAKVSTTTHDRDGVTDFDIELARQIDELLTSKADKLEVVEKAERSSGTGT
jgi:4a-hydroxytetrahydrobiopterin dehydratase